MFPHPVRTGFLQVCTSRGALKIDEASEILSFYWNKYCNDKEPYRIELLKEVVDVINKSISKFDQELKIITFDLNQEEYVVFIFTPDSPDSNFEGVYPEDDVHYFFQIIEEIISSDNCSLSPIKSLNLTSEIGKSFTKERAQELMRDWTETGYFIRYNDQIYFGPKMVTEYQPYLRREFPDLIKNCGLCKEIIFWFISCKNCDKVFHSGCINKYLSNILKCPSCATAWNNE